MRREVLMSGLVKRDNKTDHPFGISEIYHLVFTIILIFKLLKQYLKSNSKYESRS